MSTWGELGTALAGVDLQVRGEQYLWSHRPAVFIFNHQSAVETLLLCKLLRRDFVGIAKQELQRNPIFGPMFAAGGTIFVDRFNHDQAVQALEPAVDALRRGLSIVIAPEGTRSPTPRLGTFKKGAFHLAMAAKAPIVPIVFKQHARRAAQARHRAAPGDRRGRGAQADRHRDLEAQGPRQAHRARCTSCSRRRWAPEPEPRMTRIGCHPWLRF